jgi:hypothetical protein
MTPHSLSKVRLSLKKPRYQPGSLEARHGPFTKGTVLPPTQVQACPRVKVAAFPEGWLPQRLYARNLEQNQQIASCCRHPENHEIEALKSHPDERVPDIYIFHCTCGRKHRVFCVGIEDDERPIWS